MIVKEPGVIAGLELAARIFLNLDPNIQIINLAQDGQEVATSDEIMRIEGSARSILSAERVALNFLQRMSGIATITSKMVRLVEGTRAKILDTRKTTPLLRPLEKWAVKLGGGTNHRMGLYDMIMLKDNHIDFAGGITPAIEATHAYLKKTGRELRIEIETRTLQEVEEVLQSEGVDVIMLDNMSTAIMSEAVKMIDGRARTEASGGITEKNIRDVAETGVDFISVGALTHSVKSMDISLIAQ